MPAPTYGIGEWYGRLFTKLTREERVELAQVAQLAPARAAKPCPFASTDSAVLECNKQGGVCSLREYTMTEAGAVPSDGIPGKLCTTCPERFREEQMVYQWIGSTLLGTDAPIILGEVGFLSPATLASVGASDQGPTRDAGKIDNILVHPHLENLAWCALEMQAVYFSGAAIPREFGHAAAHPGNGIPFPAARRHPDYRSSGPKRLMPQLQIKVPALRRWGIKTAVVVDYGFFMNMAPMDTVDHISNGDILWFVVDYEEKPGSATRLVPSRLEVTTLEDSVTGLTAGIPKSKEAFEEQIVIQARKRSSIR